MSLLTVQDINDAGVVPTFDAVNASDTFLDDGTGRTFLEVVNADASPVNVTIPAVQTSVHTGAAGNLTVADIEVAVAAGARKRIGPFAPAYRGATGLITANYDNTTAITAGAFRLAKEA